ncbi:hypothetical protein A2V56_04095 [Candidatus Woesebacteria bacterium RBG_19FT_COMBO_42_9]|uniref:Uncharacterized protein n=1 Tax=Candidatus Woesebacteria bacterium RBG_16_42_24 TaxID=1802485 RepID=A0A1F7XJQ3_9BACT|nr:MAG: hypothetical protein A2V97_01270 [Candidatus Woesebacteria bacterium RBG_16_42_24]OGM17801.1 MAG: hypothetical protein A2V56_04095 [Candidatus Woesebacteria bacterium RBG_19FT_COMBO_42_9]OGM68077.1 MAG: hypothetical protein A2985_03335 [Candidatus Woesebacteria bacterium RIFCSPLOWO2_01_FULL_43_11]
MLQKILEGKPYLAWYIKDKKALSDKSALEHILSYGDWGDVMEAEKVLGISKMKSLFEEIKRGKRVNLKKRTLNYFQNYFAKYA